MAKREPFYLRDEYVTKNRRRLGALALREAERIFGYDPEGERLPHQIVRYVLVFLMLGGLLTALAVAPGLAYSGKYIVKGIKVFEKQLDPYERKLRKYRYLKRVVGRMRRQRLIEFRRKKGKAARLYITDQGKARLASYLFEDLSILHPDTWDQKWRVWIFDIPEKQKEARNALRRKLRALGFYQLQKSAFVLPYPCDKEIEFIAYYLDVWPCLTLIETQSLGRQEPDARRYFNLL